MALRVGITTFHHVINFGAVLQAYGLCKALEDLGCVAQVVDYRPDYLVGPFWRLGRRPSSILGSVVRNWRFERFRRAFMPRTDRIYRHEEELRACPPEMDVLVCGSDQVWNLKILRERVDAGFFLAFGPEKARRVAYAPSFGDGTYCESERDAIAKRIRGFHALSAREQSGRALIRELTGRESPLVLDPSLLVDDYSPVTKKPKGAPQRYMAVYAVEYSEGFRCFVRRVKEVLGLPVVNIGNQPLAAVEFNRTRLGPSEWLGWMQRASYVCTNSFHGTAFSIIFRRNFVSFPHQKRPGLTDRIAGLLGQLALRDRLVADQPDGKSLESRLQAVEYGRVEPLLYSAISRSRKYLEDALSLRNGWLAPRIES